MKIDLFIPILRQILLGVGGYLVGAGIIDDGVMDAFVGIGINAFTFAWWAYDRYRINQANKINAAIVEAVTDKVGA